MSSLCVLLELQFAPLNNELGDWFQFPSQRHRAAGIVFPILKTAAENKQSSPLSSKLTLEDLLDRVSAITNCYANRPHLCFTKNYLQTIKELGKWTGQTESQDPLHHHSQLESQSHTWAHTYITLSHCNI